MSLEEYRHQIDAIDDQILKLLEERATVVEHVAQAKKDRLRPVYDPERERRVLERLVAKGAGRFPPEAIVAVYREVMSACVALQAPVTVAFLGPEGTFTHIAARHFFGLAARYHEATTVDGVFEAVRRDNALYGVVPIENSTEGAVTHAVDALLEGGLLIRKELVLEVMQCLVSFAPQLSTIARVYSHPQALGQCRGWLLKHLASAQLVQTASTAAAVREAATDPQGAAISSKLAAEIYNIPLLYQNIQDVPENATRFVMLAKQDGPRTGDDKTTLSFSLRDAPGALKHALDIFERAHVNLSRIESRPTRQKAWDYVFFVEFEGHREDETIANMLNELRAHCVSVTLHGSYPKYFHTGES